MHYMRCLYIIFLIVFIKNYIFFCFGTYLLFWYLPFVLVRYACYAFSLRLATRTGISVAGLQIWV